MLNLFQGEDKDKGKGDYSVCISKKECASHVHPVESEVANEQRYSSQEDVLMVVPVASSQILGLHRRWISWSLDFAT